MRAPTQPNDLEPPGGKRGTLLDNLATAMGAAAGADLQAVLDLAGVSPRQVNEIFGGSGGLMIALGERFAGSLLAPLRNCNTESAFREVLLEFGRQFSDAYADAKLSTVYRLAIAERIRDEDLGRAFYRAGPGKVVAGLEEFFRAAQVAGIVVPGDSQGLASHFLALLRGGWKVTGVARDTRVPGQEQLEQHDEIAHVVDIFCSGLHVESNNAHAAC